MPENPGLINAIPNTRSELRSGGYMEFSFFNKLSFLMIAGLIAGNVNADTLQIGHQLDSCKKNIETNYISLQEFSREFNMEAVSKNIDPSSVAGIEIANRKPTWDLMEKLGASAVAYSKKINTFENCTEVEIFFDTLEEAID